MQYQMLLVCHAADGYFADGNRLAVRHILDRASLAMQGITIGPDCYELCSPEGGPFSVHAPGLNALFSFTGSSCTPTIPPSPQVR
jgi:hypothetical protein